MAFYYPSREMLVLGLDTTTRAGSCALARDGVVLRERASDATRPQASRLPGELMALLDEEAVALRDIDLFAVATGPGSFTGMRVGIATMQGLAFAAGKPLIGVSALDALAAHGARSTDGSEDAAPTERRVPVVSENTVVATWVDAWRGEVYAALYENGREVEAPTVEPPPAILARLGPPEDGRHENTAAGLHERIVFIGDGVDAHVAMIRETLGDRAVIAEPTSPLLAGTIAVLATSAARGGHMPPPHAIRPLYVRRTDAELARDARTGG
jgi:tRNA threonylcarbamoyladenosine biosynthesis protein TsaB